jgi:hypothetical protein
MSLNLPIMRAMMKVDRPGNDARYHRRRKAKAILVHPDALGGFAPAAGASPYCDNDVLPAT